MNHNTEMSRCMVLRLRVFEAKLTRNVAKFGSMSPFIEAVWNEERWKSKANSGHLAPYWNESHIFEGVDPAPLYLKIRHNSLLFANQEIGSLVISSEDLAIGKARTWLDANFEGLPIGKVLITVSMYEERRSEQSTHNTSYASIDLKEEYTRKLNELELEKEELEFYKRKYKRKAEKFNQEKRNYRAKVSEIVRRTTPKHTEESSSEDGNETNPAIFLISPHEDAGPEEAMLNREKTLLYKEKQGLAQLKDQIEWDLARLHREKQKISLHRKVIGNSQGKLSDLARNMDVARMPQLHKSVSEEKLVGFSQNSLSNWQEIDEIKERLLAKDSGASDLLELKFGNTEKITSPRRATTPKSTDLGRTNIKFRGSNFSTGKLVLYD